MECFAIGMLCQERNLTDTFELNFKEFHRIAIDTSTPGIFLALTEFIFKIFSIRIISFSRSNCFSIPP